jgi:hypothetical protein
MKVCIRLLAVFVFLLATAVLLSNLAGGVGVWIVKEPATDRATAIFGRIDSALDIADKGLEKVKKSLARAAQRLERVKKEQRQLAQQPPNTSLTRRFLARTVQQVAAPQFGDAHETLHTVAEAAVVVNSVLEDLGNLPFLSVSGLDVGQLTEMNNRLYQVETSAWQLAQLLGPTGVEPDADAANPQLSRIERTLKTMQRLIAEYEPRLAQVRQRTDELKSKVFSWITPVAILVSFLCFWIALSQVSLLFRACSWWRNAGRNNPPQG